MGRHMNQTIIDYVREYGSQTFAERPLSLVDSLVLCQLSYMKFDGMVPELGEEMSAVPLHQIAEQEEFQKLFRDERFAKHNKALFQEMVASKRFGEMKLACYVNQIEEENQVQFSAITFLLDDQTVYITFRGTDETYIGWKEDFNMALLKPVPCQERSVEYLNLVAKNLKKPFYVGGHSKGGNLAVFGAMNCEKTLQEKIIQVHCLDGPGFRPEILEQYDYDAIKDRVVKVLPYSSIVGMLLDNHQPYQVVASMGWGIAQHDPFNWIVKDGDFIYKEEISRSRARSSELINKWVLSLTEEELQTFIDTLYQVMLGTETTDLVEFSADAKKGMLGIVKSLKGIDKETMKVLNHMIAVLVELAGNRWKEETMERIEETKERIEKWRK